MTKKLLWAIAAGGLGLSFLILPEWRLLILGGLGLALLALFLNARRDAPDKEPGQDQKRAASPTPARRSETDAPPTALPIEDCLDLHAFAPRDMVSVAEEYLFAAREAGFREVRIIHGRGSGFQRRRVREMLARHPAVESFADAPPERGGWGAAVVRICREALGNSDRAPRR